jgi:cytochrome c oxidase subunit 4
MQESPVTPATDTLPADPHADTSHVNYASIFIALCILTVVSVAADMLPIGHFIILLVAVALSVSIVKASLVMLYFMHLKFEQNWKYVLLAPTITLALGLPLSLISDISVHYYPQVVPQVHVEGTVFEPKYEAPATTPQPAHH